MEEMKSVISDDRASIREIDLLRFLLDWFADPNVDVSDLQFSEILEYIRLDYILYIV